MKHWKLKHYLEALRFMSFLTVTAILRFVFRYWPVALILGLFFFAGMATGVVVVR